MSPWQRSRLDGESGIGREPIPVNRSRLFRDLFFGGLQIAVIGLIDHFLTPLELGFFVFYFFPIGYLAWRQNVLAASAASVLCASLWYVLNVMLGDFEAPFWFGFWNTGIRLIAFLSFAVAVYRVRKLLEVERTLSAKLQKTLGEVRELQGMLPICASCKKIRDDEGYWQQLETYISDHSRAEFTHGICPECARKLYPEYYKDRPPENQAPPARKTRDQA